MGIIQNYAEVVSRTGLTRYVPAGEDSRGQAICFVRMVKEKLQIFTDEIRPVIFNTPGFVSSVSKILSNDVKLDICFSIDNDIELTINRIKLLNERFFSMLGNHKNRDNCSFCYITKRFKIHFMVSDGKNLYIEQEHGDVWVQYGCEHSSEWHDKYRKITKKAIPVFQRSNDIERNGKMVDMAASQGNLVIGGHSKHRLCGNLFHSFKPGRKQGRYFRMK